MSRVSNAAVSYDFTRSDCGQGFFRDVNAINGNNHIPIPSLLGGTNTLTCLLSNGVQATTSSTYPVLTSPKNITTLISGITSSYTLEFWLRQNTTSSIRDVSTIFAIASNSSTAGVGCNYGIQLSQYSPSNPRNPSTLYMTACANTGIPTAMFSTNLPTADAIVHIAVVVAPSLIDFTTVNVSLYINGKYKSATLFGSQLIPNPSEWDNNYVFQLFASAADIVAWPGQIYYLAMYARALSTSEVMINYLAGIPNSLPVILSTMVTIKENGENSTSHYNNPSFYLSPVPVLDLENIQLNVFDLDEQSYCAQACSRRTPGSYMQIQVLTFPHTGTLYDAAGSILDIYNPYLTWQSALNAYVVKYRPPWDETSTDLNNIFDGFSFRAIDGTTKFLSVVNATVDIVVDRVPKPPTSLSVANFSVVADLLTVLSLEGSPDPTSGSSLYIQAANITYFPTVGVLYQVYSNGSASGVKVSSPGALWTLAVAYVYEGSVLYSPGTSVVGQDSFTFTLQDSSGLISADALFSLVATTPILLGQAVIPITLQGATTQFIISAKDVSQKRTLSAVLSSSTVNGKLFELSHPGTAISSGTSLTSTLSPTQYAVGLGLAMNYTTNSYFFNSPNTTWKGMPIVTLPENFTYYFMSTDGTRSDQASIPITVRNVNEPTTIEYLSSTITTIYAFSAINNSSMYPSIAIFDKYSITDPDLGVDPVRVVMSTLLPSGRITLNRAAIQVVDFTSIAYCSGGKCTGTGFSNSQLAFIAQPSDVALALNGMSYLNAQPGVDDTITVTIYDGVGGECLAANQLDTLSYRVGCFSSSASLSISVLGYSNVLTDRGSSNSILSIGYVLYAGIGVAFIVFILLARCIYYRYRIYKSTHGAQGDALQNLEEYSAVAPSSPGKWSKYDKEGETVVATPSRPLKKVIEVVSTPGTSASTPDTERRKRREDDSDNRRLPRPFPQVFMPLDVIRRISINSLKALSGTKNVDTQPSTQSEPKSGALSATEEYRRNLARFDLDMKDSSRRKKGYMNSHELNQASSRSLSKSPVRGSRNRPPQTSNMPNILENANVIEAVEVAGSPAISTGAPVDIMMMAPTLRRPANKRNVSPNNAFKLS